MRLHRTLLPLIALMVCTAAIAAEPDSARLFSSRFPDATGKMTALADYRGRALVVNFWARWCAPCREEIPELNQFRDKHGRRIEVIGIGLEDEPAEVAAFRAKFPMNYPVFLGGDAAIPLMQALGNTRGGLPFTVYVAADGRIVGQKLGRLKAEDLETASRLLR